MLQLTILTGESKIVTGEFFKGLNHLWHDSITSSSFPEHFGFTETEVDSLISNFFQLKPESKNIDIKNKVRDMYKGYFVERNMICNPLSIIKCLSRLYANKDQPFSNFWVKAGSIEIIENALKKLNYTNKI